MRIAGAYYTDKQLVCCCKPDEQGMCWFCFRNLNLTAKVTIDRKLRRITAIPNNSAPYQRMRLHRSSGPEGGLSTLLVTTCTRQPAQPGPAMGVFFVNPISKNEVPAEEAIDVMGMLELATD